MRNKTQRPEDFKYDAGFIFGKNFAKDKNMQKLFKGLADGEKEDESALISPHSKKRGPELGEINGDMDVSTRQAPPQRL